MQDFERLSVRIYRAQLPASRSKQVYDALTVLLSNEKGHVENLGKRLAELKGADSQFNRPLF